MRLASSEKTTTSDRLTTVLSYGALLLLGYLVLLIFEPFLVPLAWSAVLAIFFFPLHEKLKARMGTTQAALVSTLAVTVLLIVPSLILLVYTTRQAIDALTQLQSTLQHQDKAVTSHAEAWMRNYLPAAWRDMDFSEPLRQGMEKVAAYIAGSFGYLVKHLFTFFVHLFILLFALFFMFRDGEEITRGVQHLFPFDEDIQKDMMHESRELIFASVAVALLIAVIQGALGSVAFAIVGLATPIFWGVLIAFLSMVPVVGSALVWIPAAVWLGITGHWGKAVLILAVCGGVATIADNIVRPMLLRNRTHLNELLLFISVLGGLEVFGLLGLVAGPTIVAAAMGVFRVYMEHRDLKVTAKA
ncbi:MAG TPA: AI-2E family transporter [Candidatus Dormibacteraeota bacterium]|nr:AI-2E family transporter [Candidatus Dormibacteraeota bacterium]